MPVSDDFSKFFIISFVFFRRHLEGDLLPAVVFVFSREGPVEEFGAAEELAETPEAIEMPVVLWHVARCTGVEDLVGAAEDFGGGAEDIGGAGAA